jgi:hypothetical protein
MDLSRQTIERLRNDARIAGKAATATVVINGRLCEVTATPGRWPFQGTSIKITHTFLDGRQCTVNFTYDEGRGVKQGFENLQKQIEGADREFIAATEVPMKGDKGQILAGISQKVADYTQPKSIGSMNFHAPRIYTFLHNVKNFVRQNDLTKEEILTLKQELRKLCGDPIIRHPRYSNFLYSINEWDSDPHCRNIALQAESLEILLDAKACGQVGLEKNIPPKVEVRGCGVNTVAWAHTKAGTNEGNATGQVLLKPCDQSKRDVDPRAFTQRAAIVQSHIGTASGSYRRNQATTRVQAMFDSIGKQNNIEVPHVIASVSAAEMSGIPSIATEMFNGPSVAGRSPYGTNVDIGSEFVRKETWMQIQDVLTGQMNRNGHNVVLTKNGPVAFDHDSSFPTNPPRNFAGTVPWVLGPTSQTPFGPRGRAIDNISWRNYCMPPVIDRDMYNVIIAIDLGELKATYEECGLTRPEISAAMARARGLHNAALWMEKEGRVIGPNQWVDSPVVQQECNASNFYARRHCDDTIWTAYGRDSQEKD